MDKTETAQQGAGQDASLNEDSFEATAEEQSGAGMDESGGDARLKAESDKAKHYYDQWVRTTADLDNYKKRAARERQDAIRFANEALLEKLLPILDNFEMALAATSGKDASLQSVQQGVSMIYQQLKNVLAEAGLQEIDASGKTFDANWHEALSQQATADVPEGQVVQQLRKGYKLRDRLVRPAGVVVAKKP